MSSLSAKSGGTAGIPIRRGKSKQERLRSHLLGEIARGVLNPGDVLVPERQLAELMQISRSTVRQTLGDLENEGLVLRVQGKGTFVAERTATESANRSAAYAIVVLDVVSGYYRSLLSGFEEACSDAGRPAVVCNSGNSVDRQANHLMRLLAQRVAGIVLNPSANATTQPYQVELLQDAGIPVLLLHRAVSNVVAPLLELPAEETGERAARMLLEAGHRHVAFFDSYPDEISSRTEQNFRGALTAAGMNLPEACVVYGQTEPWSNPSNFEAYDRYIDQLLPQLLSRPHRPTALFVNCDSVAEHIYLATQRLGIRIPGDLSILCFGGAHREGAIQKRLTAITVDEVGAGKKAVELLQEMHAGRRRIKESETFRMPLAHWAGETLGRPGRADNAKDS